MQTQKMMLVTYASVEDIKKICESKSEWIVFAEYCVHDKDTTDDGKLKVPHVHLILYLNRKREIDEVCRWFRKCVDSDGNPVNTFGKPIKAPLMAHRYLIHESDDEEEI